MPTPGWQNSNRRNELPREWHKLRAKVKKRDGDTCVLCGRAGTDVDHIVPGDDHSLMNLRLLCSDCHLKKSAEEGGAAYRAKRRAIENKLRRTEQHPGIL